MLPPLARPEDLPNTVGEQTPTGFRWWVVCPGCWQSERFEDELGADMARLEHLDQHAPPDEG